MRKYFYKYIEFRGFNYIMVLIILLFFYSCMVTLHSDHYQKILNEKTKPDEIGKAKFLYGDMGGIYPYTLKTNGFIYKLIVMALSIQQSNSEVPEKNFHELFTKYGFAFPDNVWNWENSEIKDFNKPAGLIFGKLQGIHPTKEKFLLETADFGCASCHGGLLYNQDGKPTKQLVLGIPNTSLNLNAFAQDVFEGYKKIIKWNKKEFEKKLMEFYPNISKEEITGMKLIFSGLKKELPKLISTRKNPAPFHIGGAGLTNGIGALKRGLGLIDESIYHEDEIALVSVPAIAGVSFRSNFLICGNYAPKNREFFSEITLTDTSTKHDMEMAKIISAFTIPTMGYDDKMAEKAIPDLFDVMLFLSKLESPPFPGNLDLDRVESGRKTFQLYCQSCHGKYEGNSIKNKLISFPNQLIPLEIIKTDSIRATVITDKIVRHLNKIVLKKYIEAKTNRGYIAPILHGVWLSAPFLHNGSVPTLWHLMHPETRPEKFYVGGHELDYEKIGIKGIIKDNVYKYSDDYTSWSDYEIYNTKDPGRSNVGHDEPFIKLPEKEKSDLLEFLKTL